MTQHHLRNLLVTQHSQQTEENHDGNICANMWHTCPHNLAAILAGSGQHHHFNILGRYHHLMRSRLDVTDRRIATSAYLMILEAECLIFNYVFL